MSCFGRQIAFRHRPLAAAIACALAALLSSSQSRAQVLMKEPPPELRNLDLDQKPGAQAPADAEFLNSKGEKVAIGSFFNQGKPIVLSLVYYDCPMICPLTLERLQDRLNGIPYTVGEDYTALVVSFDDRNTTSQAATNKSVYLAGYNKDITPEVEAGWEFFTGDVNNIFRLTDSVGFRFKFIPEAGEYAHGSALIVLTPDGRVSRYLDGLGMNAQELRIALLEASEGKIAGGITDFFLHTCFKWSSKDGRYTLQAFRIMQFGALLTAAGVFTLLVGLRAGERARAFRRARALADQRAAHHRTATGPTP